MGTLRQLRGLLVVIAVVSILAWIFHPDTGVTIAGVRLGMTRIKVEKTLGKPARFIAEKNTAFYEFPGRAELMIQYGPDSRVHTLNPIWPQPVDSPRLSVGASTLSGVSREEDVLHVLGAPNRKIPVSSLAAWRLEYDAIDILLNSTRVIGVEVHER